MRNTRSKELGAVSTGLGPKGRCTHRVYNTGLAAAAPQGRNAAPPRSRASKTAPSRGTDVNEGGASPPDARVDGEKGSGPGGHAPHLCPAADWTRESSHSDLEACGEKGAGPGHASRSSAVADWPTESPRSILEGSARISHQGSAEDWLFLG